MCGIFGIYNINKKLSFNCESFEVALLQMKHRGPDAHEFKLFDTNAILGHIRLSIIDLDIKSNQPFQIDDRYWIVFNGEIYNYIELRIELEALGYKFRTQGDTEVLLNCFIQWGKECVNRFNGMWAFVIYDSNENVLFCSRDRFGVKPFNYAMVEDQFVFSSEIKGIISYFPGLKQPNYNVIANYCRTSVGAQIKETWFERIFRLEPGHNLEVNANGLKSYKYWEYPKKVNRNISFEDAVIKYKELFLDAVKLRMRSDVPVGFTLSSGLDSSSIVSVLGGLNQINKNTYTALFRKDDFVIKENQNLRNNEWADEAYFVKKMASELNLNYNIIEVDLTDYTLKLREIIRFLESGHSSPAILPLFQVMDKARNDVTVVLEGQGADELLGGYVNNVFPIFLYELLKHGRFIQAFKEFKVFKKNYSLKSTFLLLIRLLNVDLLKRIYLKRSGIEKVFMGKMKNYSSINDFPNLPFGFDDKLNNHLYKAHTGGLVNLLHYGDAISMAKSLESRLPFMDYRLVEFCFTLPFDFKFYNGLGKYIHREAMREIVPDFILDNPLKFGFETPLKKIFNNENVKYPKSVLLSDQCINRGFFSKSALINLFDNHNQDNSRLLFRLLSVELWFREFID
jgi:asparagine synthase (glutamine-hydrolysing)